MKRNMIKHESVPDASADDSAIAEKKDFLSRINHEIRTPLNAIIGMSELARKSTDPQKVQYYLEEIENSSHRLLSITNDMPGMFELVAAKPEIGAVEPASASPRENENAPALDWSAHFILLVDDNQINCEIVIGMLEDTGINIDQAGNGLEAVEMFLAAPNKYRLIFMDVQMPLLDGLSATREIRASAKPGAENIPIIALTANAFADDVQLCLEAGMNGHIAKPFQSREIIAALKSVIDNAALQ